MCGNEAASSYGGAFRFAGYTNVTAKIEGCTFKNNKGTEGGAIYAEAMPVTIKNSTFTGNSCSGNYGGALRFNGSLTANIEGSTFTDNTAISQGGAIYSKSSTVIIKNSNFTGNSVSRDGGGALISWGGSLSLTDTTVTGNTTAINGGGGGIYADCNVTVSGNTVISGNKRGTQNNNLTLAVGRTVTVLNPGDSMNIGVKLRSGAGYVTGKNSGDYTNYFTSDDSTYDVYNLGTGASYVVKLGDLKNSFFSGGIRYKVLTGNGSTGTAAVADGYVEGNVTIPETVIYDGVTYTVTEISEGAFKNCEVLTGVTLPDDGVTIGDSAFYNCPITELTIPASVTSIGYEAFNKVAIDDVTFKIADMAAADYSGVFTTDSTTEVTGSATVKLVGFNNQTEINGDVRNGQLLMSVLDGYDGNATLYYQIKTEPSTDVENQKLIFRTSNLKNEYDGICGDYAYKDEIYAALCQNQYPTKIICNVYESVQDDSKNWSFRLIATKTYDDPEGSASDYDDLVAEFSESNLLVMQEGETTSLLEILATAGFTHLNCSSVVFNSVALESGESVSVDGDTKEAEITAVKGGLSRISFNCYTYHDGVRCTYHGAAGSPSNQIQAGMYIYVVEKPDLSAAKDTITVIDKTTSPAVSKYRIGLRDYGTVNNDVTTFAGLQEGTEYDVVQELNLTIEEETYTGHYHNCISTKRSVTGVTLDKTSATLNIGDSETLSAAVSPDDAFDTSVTWSSSSESVATVDKNGKITAVAAGTATITVTTADGGKTATCIVTVLPTAVKNAKYAASLILNKNIDINFKMSNLGTDSNGTGFEKSRLTITVDGENWTDYTVENGTLGGVLEAVEPKNIGKNLHIVVTYDGVEIKNFNYSVKSYCEAVFNAQANDSTGKYDKLSDLCEALLNYGKYAQDYANGDTESTVNEGHEAAYGSDYEFTGLKDAKVILGEYAEADTGAYLTLGSTIKLNFILKSCTEDLSTGYDANGNADPNNPQNFFVLNDKAAPEQIDPKRVKVTASGTDTIVSIDLYASQLSTSYTLKLKGVDTSEFCITYGVYNYCSAAQGYDAESYPAFTDTLKTLCKAIHNYSAAVDAYIESTK